MNEVTSFLQGRFPFYCSLLLGMLVFNGCAHSSQRIHWLYDYIPEHRQEIKKCEGGKWAAWAIFGNDDDGLFGEKKTNFEGDLTLQQALCWQIRNPFHNFCFYVIGTADKQNDEFVFIKLSKKECCFLKYQEIATTVFADKDSSFFFGLHGNKPFISLRIRYLKNQKFDFYLGWRERGNFGIKLLLFSKA